MDASSSRVRVSSPRLSMSSSDRPRQPHRRLAISSEQIQDRPQSGRRSHSPWLSHRDTAGSSRKSSHKSPSSAGPKQTQLSNFFGKAKTHSDASSSSSSPASSSSSIRGRLRASGSSDKASCVDVAPWECPRLASPSVSMLGKAPSSMFRTVPNASSLHSTPQRSSVLENRRDEEEEKWLRRAKVLSEKAKLRRTGHDVSPSISSGETTQQPIQRLHRPQLAQEDLNGRQSSPRRPLVSPTKGKSPAAVSKRMLSTASSQKTAPVRTPVRAQRQIQQPETPFLHDSLSELSMLDWERDMALKGPDYFRSAGLDPTERDLQSRRDEQQRRTDERRKEALHRMLGRDNSANKIRISEDQRSYQPVQASSASHHARQDACPSEPEASEASLKRMRQYEPPQSSSKRRALSAKSSNVATSLQRLAQSISVAKGDEENDPKPQNVSPIKTDQAYRSTKQADRPLLGPLQSIRSPRSNRKIYALETQDGVMLPSPLEYRKRVATQAPSRGSPPLRAGPITTRCQPSMPCASRSPATSPSDETQPLDSDYDDEGDETLVAFSQPRRSTQIVSSDEVEGAAEETQPLPFCESEDSATEDEDVFIIEPPAAGVKRTSASALSRSSDPWKELDAVWGDVRKADGDKADRAHRSGTASKRQSTLGRFGFDEEMAERLASARLPEPKPPMPQGDLDFSLRLDEPLSRYHREDLSEDEADANDSGFVGDAEEEQHLEKKDGRHVGQDIPLPQSTPTGDRDETQPLPWPTPSASSHTEEESLVPDDIAVKMTAWPPAPRRASAEQSRARPELSVSPTRLSTTMDDSTSPRRSHSRPMTTWAASPRRIRQWQANVDPASPPRRASGHNDCGRHDASADNTYTNCSSSGSGRSSSSSTAEETDASWVPPMASAGLALWPRGQ